MSPHDQQLLQEVHARAQMAELERDTALRELEQIRRDNAVHLKIREGLAQQVADFRADRERLVQALQDLADESALPAMGHPAHSREGLATALEEAVTVLAELKRGGGR